MRSTPVLFSTTSHFPLPPAMKDLECLPARVNQNSFPSSIAFFIHPRFCFSIEILFCDFVTYGMSVRTVIPVCQAGIRDINHLVYDFSNPVFTVNPQIGVEFYSTEVTSQMLRCASFYRGCYELLSHLQLATAWTISFSP